MQCFFDIQEETALLFKDSTFSLKKLYLLLL